MQNLFKYILRFIIGGSLVFIVLFAIAISILRIVIPRYAYRQNFINFAQTLLHTPVSVTHISTDWYGFQPRLHLDDLDILDTKTHKSVLHIDRLMVQVNLFESLWHWQILPNSVAIHGAKVQVMQDTDFHYFVSGFTPTSKANPSKKLDEVLLWLLTQSDILVDDVSIHWLNQLYIYNLGLHIKNRLSRHRVLLNLALDPQQKNRIKVIADLDGDMNHKAYMQGRVYMDAKHMTMPVINTLSSAIPELKKVHISQFKGGLQLWLDLYAGKPVSGLLQYKVNQMTAAQVNLRHVFGSIALVKRPVHWALQINNYSGALLMPHHFEKPLSLRQFELKAEIINQPSNIDIQVPLLVYNDGNLHLNSALHISKVDHHTPMLDMTTTFALRQLKNIMDYIPNGLLKPHLNQWVQQAFLGGSLERGAFIFRGALNKKVFSQKNAKVELNADLHHLDFSYAPGWPKLYKTEMHLVFKDKQLTLLSDHLWVDNNFVDHMKMRVPLRRKPIAKIAFHTATTLQDAWHYIEQTPMPLAERLKPLRPKGAVDIEAQLGYPLHDAPHHDVQVFGYMTTHDASVYWPRWQFTISHIKGRMYAHNNMLTAHDLHAVLFGKALVAEINTRINDMVPVVEVSAHGRLSLDQPLLLPLTRYMSGSSMFDAHLSLHDALSDIGDDVHLHTDLFGIKTHHIPKPFAKAALDKRPLDIDVAIRGDKPLYVKARYDDLISAAIIYKQQKSGLQLTSASVQLGKKPAYYLPQPGLAINGYLSEFNWKDWQKLYEQFMSATSQAIAIKDISVSIGLLSIFNQVFHDITIQIQPIKQGWQVSARNKVIDGMLRLPHDQKQKWRFAFKKLYLQKLKIDSNQSLQPSHLPPLEMTIDDFAWDDQHFGSVLLSTMPTPVGLKITQLSLLNKTSKVAMRGYWKIQKRKPQTFLHGTLKTDNLAYFLKAWQDKPMVYAGRGSADFSLWWDDKPYHINWAHLLGSVKFKFKEGSVVNIDNRSQAEIGIGRILNLLSIGSILRRLELNFDDLTHKGLWFDTFNGQWTLNHGRAVTEATHFVGPVIDIKIDGQLDLVHNSSNLWLYVTPQLTASVPTIVGFIGGPIAGAAAWVVNKVVGPEINKISASTYHVTGAWKQPKIAKVSRGHTRKAPIERRV